MASASSRPNDELATVVGKYVLGVLSLGRAAEEAEMSRWEFEAVLEDANLTSRYGPRTDNELQQEVVIDDNRPPQTSDDHSC
jgi:predicted HTH domain antitoxin